MCARLRAPKTGCELSEESRRRFEMEVTQAVTANAAVRAREGSDV